MTAAQRFWAKVSKPPDVQDCWEWIGYRNRDGYGRMRGEARRLVLAHRLSFELHNGPVPDDQVVMHTCDNPACVNPAHLRVGTQIENICDRDAKGRGKCGVGERQHLSKLTAEQAISIRQQYRAGQITFVKLAEQFGVHPTTVRNVVKRHTWKHLQDAS